MNRLHLRLTHKVMAIGLVGLLGLLQVHSAARSLSGESNRLKLEVGKFLDTVRAA
jgi:hypothetical protein